MSRRIVSRDERSASGLESGLEALRLSPEFRGPVESLDGHQCNDHFAQIYESDEERFEAAIPFVRHGLERNERCLYVVDESTEAEVKAAMGEAGIDVDAGGLSFHTVQETYLRNGTFDPDEMIDFYAETVADATAEYDALRIVAETTWLQEDATTVQQFMEYESKVNELFDGEDCFALCQYDRDGFPPEIVREIVQTHPHLIHEGTVCHNVYYTPPEEFFGPDQPAREVDRMLGTLRERTEAKEELEVHQRHLRRQNDITASPDKTFEEKLQELFELGQDRFGLEFGAMARVDREDDRFEVEYVSDDHEHFEVGVELPLSETYCTAAAEIKAAGGVADPEEEGYDDIHVYREFGIRAYLGTYIEVDGGPDRTFFFVASEPRMEDFSDDERAFLRSMGQWVKSELERRRRERFLHESYEITSDPALSFEEKLEQLLDLGRDWMGLDAAGLAHLPEWDGKFLTEYAIGYGDGDEVVDASDGVWTDPGGGCYCRAAISEDEPVGMVDVRGTDWEDDTIHQEHGLTCYLGTKVMNGSTPYGTLWVGSTEPRGRPFSETERTFLRLMGQWVSYEIERREHNQSQRELYEIAADRELAFEEKLRAVFDLGCERFDMELGGIATVDPAADRFEVEVINGEHEHLVPGKEYPLYRTYCEAAVNDGGTCAITDPVSDGFEGTLCYERLGVRAYLGTHLEFEDIADRTFWFVSTEPREEGFSDAERTFHHLMGQWVQYELERRQRERELRERTEHLNALVETTPECIKTVAPDGTLLQMNPTGLDMVEADSASDVTGECVYDLIAPEHRERFREFNERICSGERRTLEFDIIGLDGTRRHMESHAAPLERPDGTIVHVALTRDVTEQKERQAELRRTKNRFKTVFEQSDDAIFIIDPEADELVDANSAACEMTGYTREELLSLAPSDLHPDELERFRAFLDEVRETGSAWTEDLHCRHRDDYDIPAEVTGSTITLDGRELVLANVRHIEERKKHERYQRDLYEITADPDLSFDEKLERLLELGRDRFSLEMGGLNHLPSWDGKFRLEKGVGLGLEPDEEVWTDPDSDCYCRQTITEEGPVEMTDVGGTRWAEDTIYREFEMVSYLGTKVSSGSTPYGTLWFGGTEPRERPFSAAERSFIELMGQWVSYEIERREHKQSQQKLYEITSDSDLSFDEKVDRLLDLGREQFGLDMGFFLEKQGDEFGVVKTRGTDLEEGVATLCANPDQYCKRTITMDAPVGVEDAEAAGWDDDPLYREYDLGCYLGTKVTDGTGVFGSVCFADSSARNQKFSEDAFAFLDLLGQWLSYELERRERETELEETIDQLQQSNDRLKQFAYAASHDLQEPLRMVSSYLQLLENQYADDLDDDAREYIDFAVDGADRMRAMVDDLLAFSRVEQADSEFERIDCNGIFERVTNDLQVTIDENDAEISAGSLPTVRADGEQLEQMFCNLVSNAIKYSGDEPPEVEIAVEERGSRWEFAVADNGIGIEPDKTDRIFEVFKRLHHDDEYPGTGIGLSLCQEIVENHGGDIWVESDPGEGSTFFFTIPKRTAD